MESRLIPPEAKNTIKVDVLLYGNIKIWKSIIINQLQSKSSLKNVCNQRSNLILMSQIIPTESAPGDGKVKFKK